MKTQVLSVEQMKHLQELGVDTSKASMMYHFWVDKKYKNCFLLSADTATPYDSENVPTFTLQDMLEMMPRELYILEEKFILEIYPFLDSWYVRYMPDEKSELVPYSFHSYKIINAAYQCLCWLAENGYLKGGENERK